MPRRLAQIPELSFRAKRGICFFFVFGVITSTLTAPQPQRPKIFGVGTVTIDGRITSAANPLKFYSQLLRRPEAEICAGATCVDSYTLNDHQQLNIYAGPRLDPPPQAPPRNNLEEILFETDDVDGLRDYLIRKGIQADALSKGALSTHAFSKGDAFTVLDPDGHWVGFIQFDESRLRSKEEHVSTRIIHAGFVVRNRVAMEHFYKDILGFRPYWHGGMKDNETDWLDLQVPDGTDWLEFMLNVPADADKKLLGVMNHIALGVPDIHAAAKRLLTNGMRLTEEPTIGRDGKWQLNLYDPDDTRVELMEFTPVEKPCCSDYTGPHPKP